MRRDVIEKVGDYIRRELPKLATFRDNNLRMAEYRIEHSFRVAHIAKTIAEAEGFDAERAYVAGLLHDIGYSVDYTSPNEYINHGRVGASLARPFLESLGAYSPAEIDEMCYGIAIHVDDKSDFAGERTPLALTVQDADNIDRFDAFRLYEGLLNANYRELPLSEQKAHVEAKLSRLPKLRELPAGTETGKRMWQEKIDCQIDFFYRRLKDQIDHSF